MLRELRLGVEKPYHLHNTYLSLCGHFKDRGEFSLFENADESNVGSGYSLHFFGKWSLHEQALETLEANEQRC
jgi:hypothetical protein